MTEQIKLSGVMADADLSSYQFKAVQMSETTDRYVSALSNANAPQTPVGILQNDPAAAGEPAEVVICGQCKMEYGDTIVRGANISVNNAGEAISDAESTSSSDLYHIGVAIESGVDGDIREVVILPFGLQGVE